MTLLEEITEKVPAAVRATQDAQAIADALNVGRVRVDPLEMYASIGISERYPVLDGLPGPLGAELLFRKLEAFSAAALASGDTIKSLLGGAIIRQMGHLQRAGLAVGSPAVIAMLASIAAYGGITQAEADALVSVAAVPDPITEFDVRCALWADDGEYLA